MRPNQLLSSLYLAQAALAAPILLVAGSSAKAVFIRPARQMAVPEVAQVVFNADDKPAPKPSTTVETNPASLLGSDSPLTTAQLMAIAQVKSTPEVPPPPQQEDEESTQSTILMTTSTTTTSSKGKVSVGTLVVPGSRAKKAPMSQVFDGKKAPSLYLVPGYYISSRQADIFVVGIILAFVLAVLAVETCGPVSRTYVADPQYAPMAILAC